MAKKDEAVLADTGSSSAPINHGHSGWLIFIISLVLIGAFVYWYKYKKGNSKYFSGAESRSLLQEEKVNYENYVPIH